MDIEWVKILNAKLITIVFMVKLFFIQSFSLDYFLLTGCTLLSRVDVSNLDAALESCVQVENDLIKSEQLANLRLCLDDDVEVAWFSESSLLGIVHYRFDGLDGNRLSSLLEKEKGRRTERPLFTLTMASIRSKVS